MKCPHCEKEIEGVKCPECDSVSPESAKYCMECGAFMTSDESDTGGDSGGFDLDDRVLCEDGTCTGIIIDGKCTECGKVPGEHENEDEE
ncbi:hypothetical protein ACFL2O_08120 [Thermodesulfobacteriota bacterium]